MPVALVVSGGVALCAYHAGAYEALHAHAELRPTRIAGSSGGAVIGALVAGNAPERRLARLRELWEAAALEPAWSGADALAAMGSWRRPYSAAAVGMTRMIGRTGMFRPRSALEMADGLGVYDLAPLQAQMESLVDFALLNRAEVPLLVAATDVLTGEPVTFDTARGERLAPAHFAASCGFLPEFPPIELGGRLLGDGGLSANAPVEAALDAPEGAEELVCFVVEAFSPASERRPLGFQQAAARRLDLLLAAPTVRVLRLLQRQHALRVAAGEPVPRVRLAHLAYRASPDELADKMFDFSRASLRARWQAGHADMTAALEALQRPDHRCQTPLAPKGGLLRVETWEGRQAGTRSRPRRPARS